MAWRPTGFLIEGELDNTQLGKIVGWMKFVGKKRRVQFQLDGNFHRDIQGGKISFSNPEHESDDTDGYMKGFAQKQTGNAGDITLGLPPQDYVEYPYIEWYSDQNGRCVLELDFENCVLVTAPKNPKQAIPIDRKQQNQQLFDFMCDIAECFGEGQ